MDASLNLTITAVFEFLVIALLTSTICLAIAAVVTKLCRRCSAALRFLVWRSGVLLALSLPIAICLLPKIPLGWTFNDVAIEAQSELSSDLPMLSATNGSELNATEAVEAPPLAPFAWDSMVAFNRESNESALQPIRPASETTSQVKYVLIFKFIVVLLWLVVASIRLVYLCRAVWQTHRWRMQSQQLPNGVQNVRYSADIEVPMTIGGWHPLILLPTSALSWSNKRLKVVLDHEQAHILRRDVLWNLIASSSKAILWFQPLLWMAQRQMILMSEQACDDQVILHGTHPNIYASELVELVSEWHSERQQWLATATSISGPPIKARVRAILSESVNRKPVARMTRTTFWLALFAILIVLATVRPFSETVQANDQASETAAGAAHLGTGQIDGAPLSIQPQLQQESDVERLPAVLSGRITDENEKPIADATVQLLQLNKIPFDSIRSAVAREWTATTNGSGHFKIAVKDDQRALASDTTFTANVEARGFVRTVLRLNSRQIKQSGAIGIHKMPPGRLVHGRLIEPAEVGYRPPKNPVIQFVGLNEQPGKRMWFGFKVKCKPDGTFSTYVPRNVKLDYIASAENYAAVRGEIALPGEVANPQEIGPIELRRGSPVFGKVFDHEGRPLAGQVVQIWENDLLFLGDSSAPVVMPISSSTKTKDDGSFELPPHLGNCSLFLASAGTSRSGQVLGDLVSNQKPPVVEPVTLELNDSGVHVNVNLRPAKTITVQGRIRWDDGSVAKGIEVRGVAMAGSTTHAISTATTDDQGKYKLEMLADEQNHHLSVFGGRKDGVWHYAYPARTFEAVQKSCQILILENNGQDYFGADWQLVNEANKTSEKKKLTDGKVAEANTPVRPAGFVPAGGNFISAADKELINISNHYYDRMQDIWSIHRNGVQSKDQIAKADQRQEQIESDVVTNLLDFESKYRGDVAAINALGQIIELRQQRPNHDTVKKAHDRALRIIADHYANDENLWLLLDSLNSVFPPDLYPDKLVEKIQSQDPYPVNRAHALFNQSDYLATLVFFYRKMERLNWQMKHVPQETIELIRKLDIESTMATINRNLGKIQQQYAGLEKQTTGTPDELRTHVSFNRTGSSFIKRRIKSSSPSYRNMKFTELARNLDFKINHLAPGKKFPTGFWKDELEDSMKKLLGKSEILLLITFTHPNDSWRHMLTRARQKQGLEVIWLRNNGPWPVSAVHDSSGNSKKVDDLIKQGAHVLHDDAHSTLALRWGQLNSEACYFIDKQGVIRAIDTQLSNLIDEIEVGKFDQK